MTLSLAILADGSPPGRWGQAFSDAFNLIGFMFLTEIVVAPKYPRKEREADWFRFAAIVFVGAAQPSFTIDGGYRVAWDCTSRTLVMSGPQTAATLLREFAETMASSDARALEPCLQLLAIAVSEDRGRLSLSVSWTMT